MLRKRQGLLITFEGIEGSGKSTQSRLLADHLRASGLWVLETHEPGGTPLAEKIRDIFLSPKGQNRGRDTLTPECEASLVLASRSQHVATVLLPALRQGALVLCDRFTDSTLAYQGFGRGLDLHNLKRFNRFVSQGLTPDVTFLFDLPVQQGLARRHQDNHQNRIDRETAAFHLRVRKGYLTLAQQHKRRIKILDARRSPETIACQLIDLAKPIIHRFQKAKRISN